MSDVSWHQQHTIRFPGIEKLARFNSYEMADCAARAFLVNNPEQGEVEIYGPMGGWVDTVHRHDLLPRCPLRPTKLLLTVDEIDTTNGVLASGLTVIRQQPDKLCRGTVTAIGPGNMTDVAVGDVVHFKRQYGRPSDYGLILDYDMLEAVEPAQAIVLHTTPPDATFPEKPDYSGYKRVLMPRAQRRGGA